MKTIMVVAMLTMPVVTSAQKSSETSDKYMNVCSTPVVQPCARPAKALKAMPPKYSKEAKAAKIEGIVLLKVLVGLDGRAHDIVIVKGPGYGLETQAIKTIMKKWVFQPATYSGAPVACWQKVQVTFRLYGILRSSNSEVD
jgi:TonB family protein